LVTTKNGNGCFQEKSRKDASLLSSSEEHRLINFPLFFIKYGRIKIWLRNVREI
jgi:hypothetical protein